jgi:hypothetical protein
MSLHTRILAASLQSRTLPPIPTPAEIEARADADAASVLAWMGTGLNVAEAFARMKATR